MEQTQKDFQVNYEQKFAGPNTTIHYAKRSEEKKTDNNEQKFSNPPEQKPQWGVNYPVNDFDRALRLVAFILGLLNTIAWGFLIIPLCWMIPMTVHCYRVYKGICKNKTSFGVCSIIFWNLVSGILLLCSKKDNK